MTVVVKVPVESVVPLAAPSVTTPVPLGAMVTAWAPRTAPAPLASTMVNVAGELPTTSDVADEVTVTVAPAMTMGICVVLPLAVAVIVAVRVAGFVVPDENVTVAFPVESVTAEPTLSTPVLAEKVTVTPGRAALEPSSTIAEMVEVVLLSDATVVAEALRLTSATVAPVVMPVDV